MFLGTRACEVAILGRACEVATQTARFTCYRNASPAGAIARPLLSVTLAPSLSVSLVCALLFLLLEFGAKAQEIGGEARREHNAIARGEIGSAGNRLFRAARVLVIYNQVRRRARGRGGDSQWSRGPLLLTRPHAISLSAVSIDDQFVKKLRVRVARCRAAGGMPPPAPHLKRAPTAEGGEVIAATQHSGPQFRPNLMEVSKKIATKRYEREAHRIDREVTTVTTVMTMMTMTTIAVRPRGDNGDDRDDHDDHDCHSGGG